MLGALSGQDFFSNSIEMLLNMDPPESLFDSTVVLGTNVEPWKLRLDPQCLPVKDGGENGGAVYDGELHTSNVINNFGPASALTMLA